MEPWPLSFPTGTYYTVNLINKKGSQVAGFPQTWCMYGGGNGTIDVGQGAPTGNCNTNGVYYPTPIFATSNAGMQSISSGLAIQGNTHLNGGANTAASLNGFLYVDGVTYTTVQQAINTLTGPGVVIVPPGYGGPATSTSTLPDGVSVMDYSVLGHPRLFVNPVTVPAGIGASCGFSVINGTPSFSAAGPALKQLRQAFYGATLTTAAQPTQWGQNVVLQAGAGSGAGQLTGYEADMNPIAATNASIAFLAVAAGQQQAAANQVAFDCITANNSVPLGAWKNCLAINGVTATGIFFGPKDGALQITQAVTSSASPQTVNTNGACAVPTSQLWVGSVLSVDNGGTHEDVTITNAACVSNVFRITGIFSQNHANPTSFTEYGMQRAFWDASNIVTLTPAYVWGSIQQYNSSNTANVLQFGVVDPTGTLRTSEYFDLNGGHVWRDVGTTVFEWLSQAGSPLMVLSDAGNLKLSPTNFSTLPSCSGNEGMVRPVSDSNTVTWGANIAGSSTNHVLAYCDGTNWTVAAK